MTVDHGYFNSSWQAEYYKHLGCHVESRQYEDFIDLDSDPLLHEKMSWCFFKGAPIFKLTHNLATVQNEVSQYLQKYSAQEGWLTEYNMRHNYSSPFRYVIIIFFISSWRCKIMYLTFIKGPKCEK